MSSALERIKNKVRNSQSGSLHAQLIDTTATDSKVNVNVNENVKVDGNETVYVNVDTENAINQQEPSSPTQQAGAVSRRPKRKKFEELHKRDTFWIRNDLKQKLDELCVGERGEKTRMINEALDAYLEKM